MDQEFRVSSKVVRRECKWDEDAYRLRGWNI